MNESIPSITPSSLLAFETFTKYYMALLIILGTFGNIFCMIAYLTSDLKKYGSTRYLIALSASDLGFVVCMALTWIKTLDLNWQDLPFVCELSTYVSSVCCFLSGWYVATLSAERCLAVCWPYLARRICTPQRTTRLIIILALLAAAINGPLFYVAKSMPESRGDEIMENGHQMANQWPDQSISDPDHSNTTDQSILTALNKSQSDNLVGIDQFLNGLRTDWLIDRSKSTEIKSRSKRSISSILDESPLNQFETDHLPFREEHLDFSINQDSIDKILWPQNMFPDLHDLANSNLPIPVNHPNQPVDISDQLSNHPDHPIDISDQPDHIIPESISYRCGVNPQTETVYRAFTTVDTVLSFSIPLVVTLILNMAIAYRLCRAASERRAMTSPNRDSSMSKLTSHSFTARSSRKSNFTESKNHEMSHLDTFNHKQKSRDFYLNPNRRNAYSGESPGSSMKAPLIKQNSRSAPKKFIFEGKITSILVAKCIAYLILNLPSYLHRIVLAFVTSVSDQGEIQADMTTTTSPGPEEPTATSMIDNRLVEMFVYLLFYTQFSTNFLLYSFNACVNGAVRLRSDSLRKSMISRSAHHV